MFDIHYQVLKMQTCTSHSSRLALLLTLLAAASSIFSPLHAADSAGYQLNWSYELANEDNDRFWDCIAYLPKRKTLAAVEMRHDPLAKQYKFTLWEFSAAGKVLRQTVLDEKGTAQMMPGNTLGIFPLENDGLLVVNRFSNTGPCSFIKLGRERRLVTRHSLSKKVPSEFYAAAIRADQSILLVGVSLEGGIVIATDLEGNVAWSRIHKSPKGASMFQNVSVATDNQGFYVAGIAGEWNLVGAGKTDVWLLRCDNQGDVEKERSATGMTPRIATGRGSAVAMVYDTKKVATAENVLSILTAGLEPLAERKIEMSSFWAFAPSITQVSAERFAVASLMKNQLRLREYDTRGNETRSFDMEVESLEGFTTVVCAESQIFVSATTSKSPLSGTIYCFSPAAK